MRPRLTIGIPTLNRADLLGRAIESALAQTSKEIEIIVSDNGSTDDTPAVIERYRGLGLRTFRHSSTISAAKHGHFLIEQARGEFFLGLSDDDFLEPEFATEVLKLFDRRPDLSFVYTGCLVHYGDHAVPALVGPPIEPGMRFLAEHYAGHREVSWCACVTRVRHLRDLGPQPDSRIMGDMFFWTKLAFLGPVGCVPCALSHYVLFRDWNDNMSHSTPPAVWARECQLTADEVLEGARRSVADEKYLSRLRADSAKYVARSTANQFVWSRLRGADTNRACCWIVGCAPYLWQSMTAWTRVAAAVALPRSLLRSLLLKAARRRAKERGGNVLGKRNAGALQQSQSESAT